MKRYDGQVIAVDFDGTCVEHAYPFVGRDVGAARVLRRLVAEGARIVLWTCRHGQELSAAVCWFHENGVPLHGVNATPGQAAWSQSPKAHARIYIDDAALGCPLEQRPGAARPHVDWREVERRLFP